MSFPPIVAFGKNSSEIHHWASKSKIGKNSFLMFDFGVKINGWCTDFTRTIFLGRPTKLHENIYNTVLRAQLAGIKSVKIGKLGDEIDFASRHIINVSELGKFFTHGNGHGVGRKIHERPSFKINSGDIVKKNDVVTIEPGIYLPGRQAGLPEKFGVRIEDMVLVTSQPKVYSKIPKDFRSMIVKT